MSVRNVISSVARAWATFCAALLPATSVLAQQPGDGGIEAYTGMEEKGQAINYVIALVLTVLVMFIAFKKPDRVSERD